MKGVKSMSKIQRRPNRDGDEQSVNSETWIKQVGWRKYLNAVSVQSETLLSVLLEMEPL